MAERSNTKAGRLAGLAYLAMIVFSMIGYATLTTLLAGDAHAVLARLAMNRTQFTLAFVASVVGFGAWVVLGVLLFRMLQAADRIAAPLLLLFVLAGAAMNLFALSPLLSLFDVAGSRLDAGTLAPIVGRYNRLLLLAQVFSGLWLFPLGWLILRSRVVPWLLGVCFLVGGFGYLMVFVTAFEPRLNDLIVYRIINTAVVVPAMLGELGTCISLLIGMGTPRRVPFAKVPSASTSV